jgi:NAD(P)H-flavin reductase
LTFYRHYFIATAAVYVPCFVYPWLRTCFEYGFTQKAYIHVEDNGFTRITVPSVNMKWKPGQHCFLRFTSFGLQAFSSHPFTICSLPSNRPDEKSELVFYIRHKRGLTEKLYNHVLKQPGASVPVLVDGPYGGINMQKYAEGDRLLVVAGGSGAGWILPFIELFHRWHSMAADEEHVQGIENKDKETRFNGDYRERNLSGPISMRVVLATRDTSSRIWFLRTVGELLSRYSTSHSSFDIDVQVYLTGDAEQDAHIPKKGTNVTISGASASSSEKINIKAEGQQATVPGEELCGRPELPLIVHEEGARAAEVSQSLSVFVCGPPTMQNDIRNAVAEENLNILKGSRSGGVYLHSEHFSWA